jgi:hypothetical protein
MVFVWLYLNIGYKNKIIFDLNDTFFTVKVKNNSGQRKKLIN